MSTRTRVTLTVQSIRDTDKWFRVATVSPDEAMEAIEGRGMHASAVDCPPERIAIIAAVSTRTREGSWTEWSETLPMSVEVFREWWAADRENWNRLSGTGQSPETGLQVIPDPPDLSCTGCDSLASVEWYEYPEDTVHICGNCGSIAGFPWEGGQSPAPSHPPPRERAPTRRERPASRVETPQPNRTFEGTWTNLGESRDRPAWGARVVVQDGEEVPEGATVRVRSKTGKVARKTAGATVRRLRDRTTGDFIRLVEVS